jgi:Ca2+/Na+ antiporter
MSDVKIFTLLFTLLLLTTILYNVKSNVWIYLLVCVLLLFFVSIWYIFIRDTDTAKSNKQKLASQLEAQVASDKQKLVSSQQRLTDCYSNLNITNYNGKKILYPPGYTLGHTRQLWKEGNEMCSMVDKTKADCGWGSCNLIDYNIPNYEQWSNSINKDPRQDMGFTDSGSYMKNVYDSRS